MATKTGPNLPSPENIVTIFDAATASKTFGYTTHAFTGSGTFTANRNLSVEYIIIAGGGGGGNDNAGGGGAGGLVRGHARVQQGQSYTIVVGAGGNGGQEAGGSVGGAAPLAVNGSNSTAFGQTALGGGRGGSAEGGNPGAGDGGSGGGGIGNTDGSQYVGVALQPSSTSGGYGNAGGGNSANAGGGGGGGGAGGPGVTGSGTTGNAGGSGLGFTFTDTERTMYAAGGSGGNENSVTGSTARTDNIGGAGGEVPTTGAVNTGSGGGGGTYPLSTGRSGGSGIVLIRYKSETQKATGGNVITYNNPYGDIFGDGFSTVGNPVLGTNPYRMAFDGSGDYIQYQDYLTPDTGAFSLVFIAKLTGAGGRGGFFERNVSAPYNGVVLGQGGPNNWSWDVTWSNPYASTASCVMSYPGTTNWFCDIGTYNGSTSTKAYRNGSLVTSKTFTGGSNLSSSGTRDKARIARRDSGSGDLPIEVGVVIVYNKELTATEVSQIYQIYRERFGI